MELLNDQYDSPWKEAIEHYFPEFMTFYFPDANAEIDWTKEHVFLDQELRAVVQDAELGTRFVDKLVRVTELSGTESWIYIHIEVQGTMQAEFAKRMFVYNYRIFDRYEKPVASLAVLADEHKQWKPTSYGYNVLGCMHTLEFPIAKLTDYDEKLDELLASDNAFGLITAAHILTRQTRKEHQERYEAKLSLVRILYNRHWDKQRVIDLFKVIDWLMTLPVWLETHIWQAIETIEEHKKMQYITSVERIAIAKGRVEGQVEGIAKGRIEGESKLLKRLLERRFGVLPAWATEKLSNASESALEAWGEAILTAPTLDAVFQTEATPKKSKE
ncbi:MAG: DUF4351 domain-containing protein [Chlorobium sp.]|nr:MAG: DUF4351 domain-containing protein [Chlorobium sp.]